MAQTVRAWTVDEFDPRWPEFQADPYPFLARLQAESPIHFVKTVGVWWVERYADVNIILTDPRFGHARPGQAVVPPPDPSPRLAAYQPIPPMMLFRDPPEHTRLRALVNKSFTPKVAERLTPEITRISGQLLDAVAHRGSMELMADYAFQLPALVIAAMLGVPAPDQPQFKAWSTVIARGMDIASTPDDRQAAARARVALTEYFADLVELRRADPQPDMISELIAIEEQGDRLTPGELLSQLVLLLIAGHETTSNLIGNGMLTLLRHPEQLAWLRAHPEAMPHAVEELLRFEPPVQRISRTAQADVPMSDGTVIPAGRFVVAGVASANRDPAVFREPHLLDLARSPNPHLSFGKGIHFCLGAPLARAEGQVAFRMLLERFPQMQLAEPGPVWGKNTLFRGLASLPVRLA